MLNVSNLQVAYGQSTIISDMNLNITENEIVAVVGRNGMGKTTLMKSLIGMEKMRGGKTERPGFCAAGKNDFSYAHC